jgi:hypothetical protein
MNSRLSLIEEQLVAELSEVNARITTVSAELSALNKDLEKLDACLAALKVRAKPSKAAKSTSLRPCPGQKEVADVVIELLGANGPMDANDLVELTKSRMLEMGRSLVGFGLRFGEVRERHLKEPTPGILALADSAHKKGEVVTSHDRKLS